MNRSKTREQRFATSGKTLIVKALIRSIAPYHPHRKLKSLMSPLDLVPLTRNLQLSQLPSSGASAPILQMVLDTMPHAVYWLNRDFRFCGANRIFLRDCGLTDITELLGKFHSELPGHAQTPTCHQDNARILRDRVSIIKDDDFLVKGDGSNAWVKTTKVPLINDQDEVIGIFCCYEDITERKRVQDAIHQIASGVSAKTGDSFFQSLAQYLGQVLGTEIVAIAEIDEATGRAETIAIDRAPAARFGFDYRKLRFCELIAPFHRFSITQAPNAPEIHDLIPKSPSTVSCGILRHSPARGRLQPDDQHN
jgi:PAS domain S-box-containing protein